MEEEREGDGETSCWDGARARPGAQGWGRRKQLPWLPPPKPCLSTCIPVVPLFSHGLDSNSSFLGHCRQDGDLRREGGNQRTGVEGGEVLHTTHTASGRGASLPGFPRHSHISVQSPCLDLPRGGAGPPALLHCLEAERGIHPGFQ